MKAWSSRNFAFSGRALCHALLAPGLDKAAVGMHVRTSEGNVERGGFPAISAAGIAATVADLARYSKVEVGNKTMGWAPALPVAGDKTRSSGNPAPGDRTGSALRRANVEASIAALEDCA
jgi:hypothetical protein